MLPGAPTSTHEARPMSPGMITGWPILRYIADTSGWSGGNARVAPLRCTHTRFFLPSTVCSSNLAML